MNQLNFWTGGLHSLLSFNSTSYLPTLFGIILAFVDWPKCQIRKHCQYTLDNYGHIYDHKSGPAKSPMKNKGICRSPVQKLNCFMHLVKSSGQKKIHNDYLAIRLVYFPIFRPQKW